MALLWDPGWLGWLAAFALFTVASITDYLDGYLARARERCRNWARSWTRWRTRSWLAAVIVMLIARHGVAGWALIAAIIILLREIMVSGLREYLAALQVSMPVSQLAQVRRRRRR